MDKKLSLCFLIGHLLLLFGRPLGENRSHLITHYDNITTDVQTNKVNSWRSVRNVSNWSFFYAGLYLPACPCFYRLPLQLGLGPIWHSGLLAIWLHCWWSVAILLWRNLLEEEYHSGVTNYRAFTRHTLNCKSAFRCSNKAVGADWGLPQHRNPPSLHTLAFHILQIAQKKRRM